jgi:hypothetical protein
MHFAGAMHWGPVAAVLQACPSAAAAEHVPPMIALHEPEAGHTANDVAARPFAPHVPPALASVRAMHFWLEVLHPTACARSHCSCAVHASPTFPATGVTQVDWPEGHTVPALHAPFTHGSPAFVSVAHLPQADVGARAQNVDAHCASSPQAAPSATPPAVGKHAAPGCPVSSAVHDSPGTDWAHAAVFAGVADVLGAAKVGTQPRAPRALHVATSP